MKHITIISLLSLLLFPPKLFAQEEMQVSKNAVELDFFNFDRLYNLNYSRAFVKKNWAVVPKIGIHIDLSPNDYYSTRSLEFGPPELIYVKSSNALNAGIDFLHGREKHFLRLGINSMVAKEFLAKQSSRTELESVLNYAIQPTVGYRFQKRRNGIYFTASLRPFILRIDAQRNETGNIIRVSNYQFIKFPNVLLPSPGIGYSF